MTMNRIDADAKELLESVRPRRMEICPAASANALFPAMRKPHSARTDG
jgi:hypothetical protein